MAYHCFGGDFCKPFIGWEQYIGSFDTIEECEDFFKSGDLPAAPYLSHKYEWFQIMDEDSKSVIMEYYYKSRDKSLTKTH